MRSTPRRSSPRAMMSRWISEVPSQIRSTRSSRRKRSGADAARGDVDPLLDEPVVLEVVPAPDHLVAPEDGVGVDLAVVPQSGMAVREGVGERRIVDDLDPGPVTVDEEEGRQTLVPVDH